MKTISDAADVWNDDLDGVVRDDVLQHHLLLPLLHLLLLLHLCPHPRQVLTITPTPSSLKGNSLYLFIQHEMHNLSSVAEP
jgi:hypothetical protein